MSLYVHLVHTSTANATNTIHLTLNDERPSVIRIHCFRTHYEWSQFLFQSKARQSKSGEQKKKTTNAEQFFLFFRNGNFYLESNLQNLCSIKCHFVSNSTILNATHTYTRWERMRWKIGRVEWNEMTKSNHRVIALQVFHFIIIFFLLVQMTKIPTVECFGWCFIPWIAALNLFTLRVQRQQNKKPARFCLCVFVWIKSHFAQSQIQRW